MFLGVAIFSKFYCLDDLHLIKSLNLALFGNRKCPAILPHDPLPDSILIGSSFIIIAKDVIVWNGNTIE